jgi:hypothetical protein
MKAARRHRLPLLSALLIGSLAVVAVAIAVLVTKAGPGGSTDGMERGLVTAVSSSSFLQVDTITMLTQDGRSVEFTVQDSAVLGNFTGSHLRAHGLEGAPVTVYFERRGQDLVVTRITD